MAGLLHLLVNTLNGVLNVGPVQHGGRPMSDKQAGGSPVGSVSTRAKFDVTGWKTEFCLRQLKDGERSSGTTRMKHATVMPPFQQPIYAERRGRPPLAPFARAAAAFALEVIRPARRAIWEAVPSRPTSRPGTDKSTSSAFQCRPDPVPSI